MLVAYAYPGICTRDSLDQLGEGRDWFFTDSHPPIMAALWGAIDRVWPGPVPILILQTAAFAIGLYLILRRFVTPRTAAIVAALMLVFPPIAAPMSVIWKDCLMAGFLALGIAGLLSDVRRRRVLGLVALCAATAMRYNALAATFPLVLFLFEYEPGKRFVARYATALGAWVALTVVALGLNMALTDKQMHFWHQSFALQDITGVLAFVDEEIPDAELAPLLKPTGILVDHDFHRAVRAKYKSDDFQQLLTGDGHLWDVPWTEPMPEARRAAIEHAWSTLIRAHLGAYVRYRLENFGETLGVNKKFGGAMVVEHRAQYEGYLNHRGITKTSWALQTKAGRAMVWLAKKTRMFRPHLYALLSLALLWFARRERFVLALLLSGLVMELTMLPLGATPDYRYSHWLVVTTCLSIVILVAKRSRVIGRGGSEPCAS